MTACGHCAMPGEWDSRRFGRWTVLRIADSKGPNRTWLCQCDCGTVAAVLGKNLRKGISTQCQACGFACRKTNASIRHDAFSKQTDESDFWAGVLAADGCVRGRHSITLGFKGEDEPFLEQWRTWIGSNHRIYRGGKRITSGQFFPYCQLTITSSQIASDLAAHYNITPRKSLTLAPPTSRLSYAYAAGLLFGDGTIGCRFDRNGTNLQWGLGWCGTEAVMRGIHSLFSHLSSAKVDTYRPTLSGVRYRGNRVVSAIARLLLDHCPFSMDRKYNKLLAITTTIFNTEAA